MPDSRKKGQRGMNEACSAWLAEGYPFIVNPQYRGGKGQPDIIPDKTRMKYWDARDLDEFAHCEVKRQERVSIEDWLQQASRDSMYRMPYVMHRRNHEEWKVTMWFKDFAGLIREAIPSNGTSDSRRDVPQSPENAF